MSLYKFTSSIFDNKKIDLFNRGNHVRDFTYVEDVANILYKLVTLVPKKKSYFRTLNIASSKPINLKIFLKIIERKTNLKFKLNLLPMQKGDVYKTYADNKKLMKLIKKYHFINIEKGIELFLKWFQNYHNI